MIKSSQYQIVIVNLDPTVGYEVKKTRPCVIVSPNEMNKYLSTIVICPITSHSKNYPSRIEFNLDGNTSWIMIDQIRTIDKSRILKKIGILEKSIIENLKLKIDEIFVQ